MTKAFMMNTDSETIEVKSHVYTEPLGEPLSAINVAAAWLVEDNEFLTEFAYGVLNESESIKKLYTDFIEPLQEFSVKDFIAGCVKLIEEVAKIPLLRMVFGLEIEEDLFWSSVNFKPLALEVDKADLKSEVNLRTILMSFSNETRLKTTFKSLVRNLNDSLTRVRIGGEYGDEGIDDGVWFRISSRNGTDWTPAILEFLRRNPKIGHVTVVRDAQVFGKETFFEAEDGEVIKNMPAKDFFTKERQVYSSTHTPTIRTEEELEKLREEADIKSNLRCLNLGETFMERIQSCEDPYLWGNNNLIDFYLKRGDYAEENVKKFLEQEGSKS